MVALPRTSTANASILTSILHLMLPCDECMHSASLATVARAPMGTLVFAGSQQSLHELPWVPLYSLAHSNHCTSSHGYPCIRWLTATIARAPMGTLVFAGSQQPLHELPWVPLYSLAHSCCGNGTPHIHGMHICRCFLRLVFIPLVVSTLTCLLLASFIGCCI